MPQPRSAQARRPRAWIALGSNLGDRRATLERAVRWIDALWGVTIEARSRWRWTEPIGPAQPRFLNGAVRVRTRLGPTPLLRALQSLERAAGRRHEIHWGPRTLDLDLVLYDGLDGCAGARRLATTALVLPHPELARRPFVIEPIVDLDPTLRHPVLDLPLRSLLQAHPWHPWHL